MVSIPPSPEATGMLPDDPRELPLRGQVARRRLLSPEGETDPLVALLAGLKREPGVPEMTDAEIAAEIAAARAGPES